VKRLLLTLLLLASLAVPASALAFHHGGLPSTACADESAGSPSNNNGEAKAGLAHNPHFDPPLPPVGTSGNGQGDGGEHCANAD
jgi:hypothetical protein